MGLLDFFKEIPATTQKVINYLGSLVPKVDIQPAPAPQPKPLIQKYVDPKTLNPATQPKISAPTGKELPQNIFGGPAIPNKDPMLVSLAKDIGGGFKDAGNIAKAVIQGTAQSGGSVALSSIFNQGKDELTTEEIAQASPALAKAKDILFGPDPLKSLQKRIGEAKQIVESKGGVPVPFTDKVIPAPKVAAGPLAGLYVLGTVGLDFTGFGGEEKAVAKILTKLDKAEEVANVLKKINVAEDLIPEYSKVIAGLNKEEDVTKALESITKIQDATKTSEKVAQDITKVKDTKQQFFDTAKNAYVPERAALHTKIIDEAIAKVPSETNPTVKIVSGHTASGKSTFVEDVIRKQNPNALIIDADHIKPMLGDAKNNGPLLHQESSDVAEQLIYKAAMENKPFTFVGNVKNTPKYQQILEKMKELGYNIDADVVKTERDVALRRTMQRSLKRQPVPVIEAAKSYDASLAGFDLLKKYSNNFNVYDGTKDFVSQATKEGKLGMGGADLGRFSAEGLGTSSKGSEVARTAEEIAAAAKPEAGKTAKVFFNVKKERKFLESVRDARPDVKISIGGQYVPRSTDELAIKARNLIKTDLATAENLARTGTDEKAVATASELIKHYSDEALKSKSEAVKNALYDKASVTAHTIAEKLTEQGRAVQAASIMGRLTPEGMLRFAAREINKYNEAVDASRGLFGLKKKIPNLTGGQTKFILDEFKRIENMADGTQKAMAFKQLNDAVAALIPSSLYSKVVAVWKAGLLTGVKTSGLNTFSNLFNGASETIKDVPAVVIDKVASLFTGERTLALTGKGTLEGTKEGFEKGLRYLRTGYDERNVATKLDYRKVNFGNSKIAKGLQKYEETIFHIMGAEDQPFFYGAKARSLHSQAIAESINKGLKGSEAKKFIEELVKSPTDKMLQTALNDAEMAVFQNETMLAKIARAAQNIPGGQFIVPFGKTPSAVAMQMINYSPVGIAKTIIQNIGKGRFDQRMLSQGLARGITGTAIMYMGSQLYKNNMINLSLPTSEKEQKLWQAEGRTPNSIKIGGKWRNANVLGPPGMALLVGASFQQALKETGSPFKALVQSVAGGAKALTDQTFLQGLSSVLDALNDPSRFVQGYFANTIASVVPTLVGDLAKSFDDVERRSPGILERIKSKIPGLRQTLEPQVTNLGQYRVPGGNWIETLIDPSRPSNILSSPVSDELRRMTDAGYNVSPTQLGDKNGYAVLSPQENTTLWKKSGELIDHKLGNLVKLDQYKKLSDEKKAKIIEDIVAKSKVVARIQAVMDLTHGLEGPALKQKLGELKKGGLMTQEVFDGYLKLH